MVSFEVYRNNERLCVAGVGAFGVLSACVTWVAHRPKKAQRAPDGASAQKPTELKLEVGGLKHTEGAEPSHARWFNGSLCVGDEIRISVIDVSQADRTTAEYRDDPVTVLEAKKTYVRGVARELGWEIREP
jgi:hypothetical protein